MSKQDRVASRTAEDVERKYNFGKTFAEVFGLAEDARKAAEQAQEAADSASGAVDNLDQDAIFNLLTNNGALKGLFMRDGQLYINASYLVTGVIKSENGKLVIDLSGASEPTFNTGISTNGLIIRADAAGAKKIVEVAARESSGGTHYGEAFFNSTTGENLVRITEVFEDTDFKNPVGVAIELFNQTGNKRVLVNSDDSSGGVYVKNGDSHVGSFVVTNDGKSALKTDTFNDMTVSWKDNGDGTYTLIGR